MQDLLCTVDCSVQACRHTSHDVWSSASAQSYPRHHLADLAGIEKGGQQDGSEAHAVTAELQLDKLKEAHLRISSGASASHPLND